MIAELKKHDIIITDNAREKWIERIVDPGRYKHLSTCETIGCETFNCETCESLRRDIDNSLKIAKRYIDGQIFSCYLLSKQEKVDEKQREILAQSYQVEPECIEFFVNKNKVLITLKKPDDLPQIITVYAMEI